MADKVDLRTKRLRRVLSLAQEEAENLNHLYIGTEHLLLGLMAEENGVAVRVLRDLGVDPNQVRKQVERIVGRGQRPRYDLCHPTPRAKQVIALAVEEAARLGHYDVGSEHLLVGLMRVGDCVALDVLRRMGISLRKVRSQIALVMKESSSQETSTPSPLQITITQSSDMSTIPIGPSSVESADYISQRAHKEALNIEELVSLRKQWKTRHKNLLRLDEEIAKVGFDYKLLNLRDSEKTAIAEIEARIQELLA